MTIICPNRGQIIEWANWVAESGSLRKYLPIVDAQWAATIEGEFQLTALSQDKDDPLRFSARLFYRIIKNHRFTDGNKRSSLLNVYLFLAMNGLELHISPKRLYHLAKVVAEAEMNQDLVIDQIAKRFEEDLQILVVKE